MKEFEKIDFGSEFKVELHPVEKLRSIGGLAEKEMLKDRWVNGSLPVNVYFNGDSKPQGPMGTAEEYEDRFNNEDLLIELPLGQQFIAVNRVYPYTINPYKNTIACPKELQN